MAHHRYRRQAAILLLGMLASHLTAVWGEEAPAGEREEGVPVVDQRWDTCPPPPEVYLQPPPDIGAQPGQTALSADEAISQSGGTSRFSGNVMIQRDQRTLQGDTASYDQDTTEISVDGNVLFRGSGIMVQGESARMRMDQESGQFSNVEFFLTEQHAFGSADTLQMADKEHTTLQGVRYTTCPPGREDWLLSAKRLELDQQSNTGEAYNTVFRFKGVPIFYSPYINFPLAGRKSGLLFPEIGSSDSNGSDIRLPVYWNIAPNYDATFTPRHLSKRGSMLMSEFRYLGSQSEGQIQADYLPDDELYGAERSYLAIDHRSRFAEGWHTNLIYRGSSDALYLSDLGANETASSTTHLERRLDLGYAGAHWNFLARAQGYQPLSGSEPYQRLPQLVLNGQGTPRPNQLQWSLQSEAVRFAHDTQVPVGTRVDLKPTLTLPLEGAAWYLKPTAALRYTQYQLEEYAPEAELSRTLPILSLDSGLIFEREAHIGGRGFTQTLEPRLFYLHVPYEDQDALPNFDTGNTQLSFSQLFRDNRFSGADRQGDANQLTTALTTRLLDEGDGSERLRASIGRIHYFEDRRVTLIPGDPIDTAYYSDLFAELELQPLPGLRLGMDVRYDSEREQQEQFNARLRYQPDASRLFSLDYRYDEADQLHQSDTVMLWPLARQWRWVGRWRYDLDNEQNLELLGGVEYESCCWSLRVVARQYRNSVVDETQNSIYFTLGFKGLGSLGKPLQEILGDAQYIND